ncbi:MAG: histidine kinase dimerization/phosphoacceptor domain-containing protein [Chloroflexota bacterium]|nr:histidine kinase dimerization/phosphoacceptor domain-containing protein [Chloroflexota bacterium]
MESSTISSPGPFASRLRLGTLFDIAIALAALGGSLALLAHGGVGPSRPGTRELDLLGVALAACSTLPLAAWRRSPFAFFTLTGAAGLLLAGVGYRIDLLLGPAAALYLAAAGRRQETPWTRRMSAVVAGLLVAYLGITAIVQATPPVSELFHTGLAWAAAWFAGERWRLRREQLASLRGRALRVEREAERERLLAAAEERSRLARDLHDSVGHAMNVIAVRAGAARLRHRQDPDRSLAALEAIEEVARHTAAEIDTIIGSLREDESANGAVKAPAGLASLDTLITRYREAGLEVKFDESGAPQALGACRSGRLPHPPGGAHQRGPPWRGQRTHRARVRRRIGGAYRYQPRTGALDGVDGRGPRLDGHAGARHPARGPA